MPVVRLEHTDDERLSAFCGLTDGQLRDGIGGWRGGGMFVGESRKVIDCALDAGVRPLALLMEEKWLEPTMPVVERVLAAYPDVPVFVAMPEQFRAVTGYEITRGALVLFQRPAPLSVEEAVRGARRVAVLEDIVNYTNVGAIFRSAVALGIDAVLLTPSCHDPLYRRAARVGTHWRRARLGRGRCPPAAQPRVQGGCVGAFRRVDIGRRPLSGSVRKAGARAGHRRRRLVGEHDCLLRLDGAHSDGPCRLS